MIGRTFHGEKLRAARRAARVSQRRFADEVGCHIGTVVRCEKARNQYVSVDMVMRFIATANRLGITIDGREIGIDDVTSVDPHGCPVCAARASAQPAVVEACSA